MIQNARIIYAMKTYLAWVTTAMPICDGLGFRERGTMVIFGGVQAQDTGDNKVLPRFRPPKKKPYLFLVACI
jgi:hypothetical protein